MMGRGRELVFDRRFRSGHLLYIDGRMERPNRSDAVVGEKVLRIKDHLLVISTTLGQTSGFERVCSSETC